MKTIIAIAILITVQIAIVFAVTVQSIYMIVGQIIGVNNSAQNHQHIFSNMTIVHAVAGV